jgi:hypothetical protein
MLLEDFIQELNCETNRNTVLISELAQKMVDSPLTTCRTMGWNGTELVELGARVKSAQCLVEQLVSAASEGNGITLERVKQHWGEKALHHGSMRGYTNQMCDMVARAECTEICQLAKRLKNVKA